MRNGWIGDLDDVEQALRSAQADKNEEGKYILQTHDGSGIFSFLGMGGEGIIEEETMFFVKGEAYDLLPLLPGIRVGIF